MAQEKSYPKVLRVDKADFIQGMLAGTFDTSKLANYTHYVSESSDYGHETYQQLNNHETDDLMFLEYENPNGSLEVEIAFVLTAEFVLFIPHETYMYVQKAEGWFRITQHCKFNENPRYVAAK